MVPSEGEPGLPSANGVSRTDLIWAGVSSAQGVGGEACAAAAVRRMVAVVRRVDVRSVLVVGCSLGEDPGGLPPGTFGANVLWGGVMGLDLWQSAFSVFRNRF